MLAMILYRKGQERVSHYDLTNLRQTNTRVADKTLEWIESERGKGVELSKLSDEEIALQDRDNRDGL